MAKSAIDTTIPKFPIDSFVDYERTPWRVLAHHQIGKSIHMYWLLSVYSNKFVTVLEESLTASHMWESGRKTDAGTSRDVKNYAGQTNRH